MKDIIQVIPPGLEKYLGVGEMVLPSEETIRIELQEVREGKLTTIPKIRESIARKFGVATTCPKSILKVLKRMMAEKGSGAYKVLNGNGELIASDLELQSELLKADGHNIDTTKLKLKVIDFKQKILS